MGWWSDTWKEITSGGSAVTETYNSSPSNTSPSNNNTINNANAGITSMGNVGIQSMGGQATPGAPANAGNPAIVKVSGVNDQGNRNRTLMGSLLGDKIDPVMATNANNTLYQPTNNPVNIANTLGLNRFVNSGGRDDLGFVNIISNDNPNDKFASGNVSYQTNAGFPIQGPTGPILTNDGSGNFTPGGGSTLTGDSTSTLTTTTTSPGGGTAVAPVVNQALLDALALRDAALARQLGVLNEQFSFSTQDYYDQLGQDYREGGLSDAFSTAYDDATRGIYDTFKSAGMLTQEGVDDKLGILAGAEGGEEGRIDSIVDQYMGANKNYVTGGHTDLSGALQGLAVDSEDIPTINAQTAAINAFDVIGKSQPYKEPTETEVVDFFTDFVKRSYDPSYNVDPSAVATGAPKRVTGSVNQKGANTAPSTIAGLFDPVTGGSVRVVS